MHVFKYACMHIIYVFILLSADDYASINVCNYASIKVCNYPSMQTSKNATMQDIK